MEKLWKKLEKLNDHFPLFILFIALIPRLYFVFINPQKLIFYQYDDAFYYYKIAWNIVHGNGISFTPGIETNGFHPLWLLMILPLFWVFRGSKIIPIQLSTLILAVTSSIAYYIGALFLRDKFSNNRNVIVGYIVLILFSINPVIYYYNISGMETGFAVMVFALAFYTHWKLLSEGENYGTYFKLWFISNVVLLWLRIDYATIVWLLNLHLLYKWKSKKLLLYIILINISISPWILWCKLKFGYWVPISGLAFPYVRKTFLNWSKGPGAFRSINYTCEVFIKEYMPFYFGFVGKVVGLAIILFLLFLYLIKLNRKALNSVSTLLPFWLWIFVYSFLQVVIRKFPRDYYSEPISFLIILFLAILCIELSQLGKKYLYLSITTAVVLFFGGVNYSLHDLKHIIFKRKWNIELIKYLQHIDPQDKIGVFNAGKIGYFLNNTVINLDGAVNPEAYSFIIKNDLWEYIKLKQIKYIADESFYIYWLYKPVMGYRYYIAHLLPVYYYNGPSPALDFGAFEIVDSIKSSHIDFLINSSLIKTRSVLYLANALREIGETEKSAKLLTACGMDKQNRKSTNMFTAQGYTWTTKKIPELEKIEKIAQGNPDKARSEFEKLTKTYPDITQKYSLLTAFYGTKNMPDSAIYWARLGIILTPNDPLLNYNLGVIWARLSNIDSSIYYFRKSIQLKPDYPLALTSLGVLFMQRNQCDSAEYYTKLAYELPNATEQTIMTYIAVLQHCKKYDKLIQTIDYVLQNRRDKLSPNSINKLELLKRQILQGVNL